MRIGDHKLFLDKQTLYAMINLRINGLTYATLAKLFSCDISSVRHQCDKYEIRPVEPLWSLERIANTVLGISGPLTIQWEIVNGQKYSKGRTYAEYLASAGYPHRNHPIELI